MSRYHRHHRERLNVGFVILAAMLVGTAIVVLMESCVDRLLF